MSKELYTIQVQDTEKGPKLTITKQQPDAISSLTLFALANQIMEMGIALDFRETTDSQ